MSQSPQTVSNGPGSTVRAAINTALQALFSHSSGSSAPSDTSAHMFWADTSTNIMWKRNAANTGWLNWGTLSETFVLTRSSNTILGIADVSKAIIATGTFTQTFDTCANLKDGWYISYKNSGSGVVTLTAGSGTIDGASSITLPAGMALTIYCNGTNLYTMGVNAVFVGDSGSGGTRGLVPAPIAGDAVHFLRGDGTWATAGGAIGTTFGSNLLGVTRAANTTYTNSTGRPLLVGYTCANANNNNTALTVNGVTVAGPSGYGGGGGAEYIIPVGATYSIVNNGQPLSYWYEC